MDEIVEFAVKLANETGNLLVDYFHRAHLKTSLKPDRTLVTEADLAADRFITENIHKYFPQDIILSEEGNITSLPGKRGLDSTAIWIVDPLDGTTNFSLGLSIWGILLTRLVDGWPELAVAHFPLLNECYIAQHGQGAWLNQARIQLMVNQEESSQPFFACCSRTFRRYQVNLPYKIRILGSAGYTFCLVARGAALIGFEVTPKIWDIAGPWLIVREAGGVIDVLDEINRPLPFTLGALTTDIEKSYPTLAAATPELFLIARQTIQRKTA